MYGLVKEGVSFEASETFTKKLKPKEAFMSKFFFFLFFLVAFTASVAAACEPRYDVRRDSYGREQVIPVANPDCIRSQNQEAEQFWGNYGEFYNSVRDQNGRVAADGRTLLRPIKGQKGVYEDPNGYRVVHRLDCEREGTASRLFWGVVVPIASLAIENPYVQAGTVRAGQAVQQHNGVSRFYKCSEVQEMLAAGNAAFYQERLEHAQVAQSQDPQPVQRAVFRAESEPEQPQVNPFLQRWEAHCESEWRQCPAGKDWGTFDLGEEIHESRRYTCRCR